MDGIGMRTVAAGLALALAAAAVAAGGARAGEVDVDGFTPGKWTMDLDAARKHAAGQKTVILLNFTGSDWCGWCTLMEKTVFSQQAWKDHAAKDVATVVVDFPQNKGLVPEKYAKRNEELKTRFGIEGFPTFVILDSDGETELGRLGAGRDKTPESFIAELRGVCRYRPAEVEAYAGKLPADAAAAYRKLAADIAESRKTAKEQKELAAAAEKKAEEAERKIAQLQESAAEFRATQAGEEKLKEYRELKDQLAKAKQELQEWLATKPQRSEENTKKYQEMGAKVQKLAKQLGEF